MIFHPSLSTTKPVYMHLIPLKCSYSSVISIETPAALSDNLESEVCEDNHICLDVRLYLQLRIIMLGRSSIIFCLHPRIWLLNPCPKLQVDWWLALKCINMFASCWDHCKMEMHRDHCKMEKCTLRMRWFGSLSFPKSVAIKMFSTHSWCGTSKNSLCRGIPTWSRHTLTRCVMLEMVGWLPKFSHPCT